MTPGRIQELRIAFKVTGPSVCDEIVNECLDVIERYRKALEEIARGYTEASNDGRLYTGRELQEIAKEALSEGERKKDE